MAIGVGKWRSRQFLRSDLTTKLIHLTKATTKHTAFEHLWSILEKRKIVATNASTIIEGKYVCFQDIPIQNICENLEYELILSNFNSVKRRFSGCGIRIDKIQFYEKGGRKVVYDDMKTKEELQNKDKPWRYNHFDLSSKNIVDWSHEREWRIEGDYEFDYRDIEIIVESSEERAKLIEACRKKSNFSMLIQCKGIIVLEDLFN